MPRTLNATLEAALDSGSFQAYFLLTVREVGAVTPYETATPLKFELHGINLSATYKRLQGSVYDGFLYPHEMEFMVTRGVTIAGVNYTINSSYYFGVTQVWDGKFQSITACMLPEQKYTAAGDVSYKTVIDAICANYNKTAVYDTIGAAWQSYKFLGAGKILNLNRANGILNMLKQKYLIHAVDNGSNQILFKAIATDPAGSADHTLSLGIFKEWSGDVSTYRRFLYRDEAGTIHYSGNATDPLWNLGYLESTAAAPTQKLSTAFTANPIAPHLKYLSFDRFNFTMEKYPPHPITDLIGFNGNVTEEFDYKLSEIPWRITIESYNWAKGTEGGALPGTIEQAAPYTPLNVSNFANVLSSTDNNIQAAMETLDDHDHSGAATTEGIQDIIGAMFSGNTETGITVTYQDSDGTIDFEVTPAGVGAMPISGWIEATVTWTRTGNHTFTAPGDLTTTYRPGAYVRYKDGGSFEYGVIYSSSHSAGTTTVTLITNTDYAMAAATITEPALSYIANPQGFPFWFNYAPTFSASGSMTFTSVTGATKWRTIGRTIEHLVFAVGTTGGTASTQLRCATACLCSGNSTAVANTEDGGATLTGRGEMDSATIYCLKSDGSNFGLGSTRRMRVQGTIPF